MNEDELAAGEPILEEDPDSLAFARLASMYLEQGDIEKAKGICLRGIEVHPFYVNGYLVLAKCRRIEGAIQEARSVLKRALRLDPDNLTALWELAQMNAAEGQTSLAVRNLRRLLQREPLNDTVRDELTRLDTAAVEEREPLISEASSLEEFIEEEPEGIDVLSTGDEEQVSVLSDEETEDREAGWELLDQLQEGLTEEAEAEEREPALVDEIESILEQEAPEVPEESEGETPSPDLSELLFEGEDQPEEETPSPELSELLFEGEDQPEEETPTEESIGQEVGRIPAPLSADREEVPRDVEPRDVQFLRNVDTESGASVPEEEVEEDLEDVSTAVQSSLDDILSSLRGGIDAEEPSEQTEEETEALSADSAAVEETPAILSEPIPLSEEIVEQEDVSGSEGDELLHLLGEISDQEGVEIQEEGDAEGPVEETSEDISHGAPSAEPSEKPEPLEERTVISGSESDELLHLLGEVSDQQETEPQEEGDTEGQAEDPIVTATLADIYASQGMMDKAIQILEEALRSRPDDLHIQNRLKEIRKQAGDTEGLKTDSSTEED